MIGYLVVMAISVLPWIELRGAIPVGILLFGLDPIPVFALSVVPNILVFFPLRAGLDRFYGRFRRYGFVERVVEGTREKVARKRKKYDLIGLATFVAVPLPVTGAWTGTLIAWLIGMEERRAFLAISIGVLAAGVMVTLLSLLAAEVLYLLGVSL